MAADHNNPQSRDEEILIATIDGTEYNKNPQSRMEELLLELKEVIEEGGGGGGTSNYENLSNQPQVNGETLIGDKSGADLGLVDAEEGKGLSTNDYDDTEKAAVAAATSAISAIKDGSDIDSFGDVETALADKQGTILHGTFDPSDGENGDLYVKTVSSSNMDVCGTPTDNTGDGYEISTNVSIYSNYEAYKAFGDGDGFGKNGMGDATLEYHITSGKKFKPSVISLCNNFDVSGGFLTSKGYAYASTDGVVWDSLFSFNDLSTKNESISFDITTNKYYSYFRFQFGGSGGYPGIKNIVILGESDSEDDNRVDNVFYKQDGKWLKDAFAKKSDLDAKQDTLTFDDVPTANSNNPVKSGGVKSAIDSAVSRCYHHAGTKTCAELLPALLIAANEGNVYEMTDSGTTTSDFMEGIGHPIKEGDNVGVARVSEGVYKFDLLSGFVDTTNFVQKSQTAGLLNNDGTVNTTIESTVAGHTTAIASVENGLTNLDNEVNGDATVYPYADVITIPDAIPANVADCNVKIEPEQNLHGYDHPWIGGAGKNKIDYRDVIKDTTSQGLIFKENTNGYISVSGRNTGGRWTIADLSMLANGNYKIIVTCTDNQLGFRIYNGNTVIDELVPNVATSFEMTSDKTSFTIAMYMDTTGNDVNGVFTVMVVPSTETDSTFAPYTNICPITGHTKASVQRDGRNLWVGTFVNDAFSQSDSYSSDKNRAGNIATPVIPSKKYCYSVNGIAKQIRYIFLDENKDGIGSLTTNYVTSAAPENARYLAWRGVDDAGGQDVKAQLEIGEVAHAYVPHVPTKTYTIALGDTIYGGTVDFDSGVMTVDRAFIEFDGSVDENWGKSATLPSVFYYRNTDISPSIVASASFICNRANYVNNISDFIYGCCYSDANAISFYLGTDSETIEEWKAYLASTPLQVCYKLATPTTIQLTPQQIQLLKGQNTLTASTGQISVTVNGVSGAIGAVQEQVNELGANAGGAKLKILKYTGTGTTSYTLDFGDDTPATIMQIIPEPGESVITNNYEYLSGFAWGVPFTYGIWANKSNNLPSNHGGFNISQIIYSDNTCTITGASASAAANYEGQKYAVYYLA